MKHARLMCFTRGGERALRITSYECTCSGNDNALPEYFVETIQHQRRFLLIFLLFTPCISVMSCHTQRLRRLCPTCPKPPRFFLPFFSSLSPPIIGIERDESPAGARPRDKLSPRRSVASPCFYFRSSQRSDKLPFSFLGSSLLPLGCSTRV